MTDRLNDIHQMEARDMTFPIKLASLALFLSAAGAFVIQYYTTERSVDDTAKYITDPSHGANSNVHEAYITAARKNDPIKLHALSTQSANLSKRKSPKADKIVVDYAVDELQTHRSNIGAMDEIEIETAISSALVFLDAADRQQSALCAGASYSNMIGKQQIEIEEHVLSLIRDDEDLHAPFLEAMTRFNAVYDPQRGAARQASAFTAGDLAALQRRASSFLIKKEVLALGAMLSAQQSKANILRRTNVCAIARHALAEAQEMPHSTRMKFAARLQADDGVRKLVRELKQTDLELQF